jgi:hypothetical protein
LSAQGAPLVARFTPPVGYPDASGILEISGMGGFTDADSLYIKL